jgi:hypothetical protein
MVWHGQLHATASDAAASLYFHDVVRLGMNASAVPTPDLDYELFASDSGGLTSGAYRFTLTAGDPRATAASLGVMINRLVQERAVTRVAASFFTEDAFSVAPGTLLLEEQDVGAYDSASTDHAILPVNRKNLPASAIMRLTTPTAEDSVSRLPLHVSADLDPAVGKEPDAAGKREVVAGGGYDQAKSHGGQATEAGGKSGGGRDRRRAPGTDGKASHLRDISRVGR